MRYRLQRHDGTDCSATMVPITVLRMVPIQRYRQIMSKEEFLSVYERQQASGLTIKDFCENETYSSSCFHYWKKKFGLSRSYTSHPDRVPNDTFIPLGLHRRGNLPSGTASSKQ